MVDANLQRETILPSERAFAYKMKLDALKHQGARTDLTSAQLGRKLETADIVAEEAGESRNQVRRYIRLTELIPDLLNMVDEKKIAFNPAVELSYLKPEEQKGFSGGNGLCPDHSFSFTGTEAEKIQSGRKMQS
ncbi:ParB-like partition protein [gut metagenome]|uniref:ParB-like partition protein n=1 Tax=gut metagenome TaxID=749906 RepID=J9BUT6_9ZZZZ